MSLGELQARVAARFSRLDLPSWPDPRPRAASPRDEEYSRITRPERYRIVHARARGWTRTLAEVPGVDVAVLEPADSDGDGRQGGFDRGVRLTSARGGTLPLLLLERDASLPGQDMTLAGLQVSVVKPDVAVAMLPDCGCDACDHGSDDLLGAIDEVIGWVVGGPFVVLQGKQWHAQWYPGGGSSGGAGRGPDHSRMMKLCRRLVDGGEVRLPPDAVAFVGRSWLP